MSAVGSSCWGSSEGQILVHVLQKLTLPTRWVNRHGRLIQHHMGPRSGLLARPSSLIHWCRRPRRRLLMRASLSSGLTLRLIQAYCGCLWGQDPPPLPSAEMRRNPFDVAQPSLGGKASAILGSWKSRDELLKTMHNWMMTSPEWFLLWGPFE